VQEQSLLSTKESDEALVERVKEQDMVAFTLLYDRYAPAIYALAAHLLGPTDADEVVQEVFLRLWHKAEQFNGEAGLFKSWFMTIARNYIWDLLKRRTHEQQLLATYEIEQRLSEPIDPVHHIAEEAWVQQQQAVLLNALHDLPPEQRRAIVMAYFGGFSQSAIAQELGWPLGTVKKRIRLGLQKLRNFLTQWQATVE
jgi:RNA polymerase sigma-70 factor, ECF subfamily